jgi:raffinose/stachyose/melibiose transport system substrate-binding protein
MRPSKLFASVALVVIVAILASCAPAATPAAVPQTVVVTQMVTQIVAGTPVEVEVTRIVDATPEPADVPSIELTVWYLSTTPEVVQLIQGLAEQWARDYTEANVSLNFSVYGFEDMNNTLRLALPGRVGPDVAYMSPGAGGAEAYAAAGHLLDLTDIIRERGWDQMHSPDVLTYYDRTDRTYGVAFESVTVGLFYNADLLAELGLQPPTTLAEFETALQAAQDAGITPIVAGGADGWPLIHIWEQLVHTNVPFDYLTRLYRLDPTAAYNSPEMLAATEKYAEWAQRGWIDRDAVATANLDAVNLFMAGESVFYIGGTWNVPTFASQTDADIRFMAMPQMNPALDWHMGGFTPNNVWAVPAYTQHQEVALDFIEYMIGQEVATEFWGLGQLPTFRFAQVPPPVYPLQADVYEATQNTRPGYYMDTSHAELGPPIWAALQDLTAGRLTPQQFVDNVQAEYARVAGQN